VDAGIRDDPAEQLGAIEMLLVSKRKKFWAESRGEKALDTNCNEPRVAGEKTWTNRPRIERTGRRKQRKEKNRG